MGFLLNLDRPTCSRPTKMKRDGSCFNPLLTSEVGVSVHMSRPLNLHPKKIEERVFEDVFGKVDIGVPGWRFPSESVTRTKMVVTWNRVLGRDLEVSGIKEREVKMGLEVRRKTLVSWHLNLP